MANVRVLLQPRHPATTPAASRSASATAEFGAAEEHFRRAISLDPSHAQARRAYAAHLMVNGRLDEARQQSLAAVELDPLSYATHFQLVVEAFLGRRFEEAARRGEVLVEMWPAAPASRLIVAKVKAARGQYEEALRELDRADPELVRPQMIATRAYIYGQLADTARVRAMLRRLDASSAAYDFDVAFALLGLDERESAYRRLEAAIDSRDRRARLLLREPLFEAFQDDPGFSKLVRRVGVGQGV
ncbi:MAG TPA: tetratricopeptide repeat protein [Longimicrobiales bacterium]|nr:tetratricopeptide repeat protein [Longimicrobiales bacterium]